MQLEALLGHLRPSAEDTKAAHAQATSELNAAVQKIGTISLTQSANDKACYMTAFSHEAQCCLPAHRLCTYVKQSDDSSFECMQDIEGRSQKVGLTAAKLELDARPLNDSIMGAALRSNQFFGLTAALLKVRRLCWHVHLALNCTDGITAGATYVTIARFCGPGKPFVSLKCFMVVKRGLVKLRGSCWLQAGDWEDGCRLLRHLIDLDVDPLAYPPIASALCKVARGHVARTYSGLYPDGLRGQSLLSRKVSLSCMAQLSLVPEAEDVEITDHLLQCHNAAERRFHVVHKADRLGCAPLPKM